MIDSGDKLKLDQNHVETVIPAPGKSLTTWGKKNTFPHIIKCCNLRSFYLCTSAVFLYPPQHHVVELPAGKQVLILNGPYRDTEALLEGIDEKNFCATLTLNSVRISTL